MSISKHDQTIGEAIRKMLREYRLQPQLDEHRLRSVWQEIMGKTIATYTSDIVVRKGVLYLTIQSAPLKHELTYAKDKIVERINEAMGHEYVKEVVIR
jgi:predicted nucleic acid-binding Zn ribbon protein